MCGIDAHGITRYNHRPQDRTRYLNEWNACIIPCAHDRSPPPVCALAPATNHDNGNKQTMTTTTNKP
eukprot:11906408-Karenia_brevis.AAC.1